MADTYTVVGSYTTIRVLGTNSAIDVEAIQIVTKPSNIRVTVLVELKTFRDGGAAPYLETTTALVEGVLASHTATGVPKVDAASYSEDTDAAGLLAAYISFLVSYHSPTPGALPFTEWVTFPMTRFETAAAFDVAPNPEEVVTEAWQRLANLAAS